MRPSFRGFQIGLRLGVVFACCASAGSALAQESVTASRDGVWRAAETAARQAVGAEPWVRPQFFQLVSLDQPLLVQKIDQAPLEAAGVRPGAADAAEITLPMPDGSFQRFSFVESPVMAPELAAKYPEIKTYLGQGLDDPSATVRFDWTPQGFHAQILSPEGTAYIDPYWKNDTSLYATYFKRDYHPKDKAFSCGVTTADAPAPGVTAAVAVAAPSGDTLRTYRLALAATGEYTLFHGGTTVAGLAAVVTALNRVDGIYETELAVRMVLVANNDLLIYTNSATDPYTNNNGSTMLGQNQSNINNVIGSSNYDVGHVFSTGGGGVAGLRVICSSIKAWGVTGLSAPIGDSFWVDFVAHEMGHQFGGNHTFNGVRGSCSGGNRNGSTAHEPGSGSTIQAYAGICSTDNLQPHSDPYFHAISFDEMRAHVTGFGGTCAAVTTTGNDAPVVNAGPDRSIPLGTPFTLTGTTIDPNGDPVTHCWEELDLGPGSVLAAPDQGSIPLFRSFNPTTGPSRTFPRLSSILSNTPTDDEKIPMTNRTMRFRLTARDNRAGGGGVDWDEMNLAVRSSAGPFQLTSPIAPITSSGPFTVTWNVAGTNAPPINTSQVDILLSTDGGNTFPVTLAAATPNDGSEAVTVPDLGGNDGRVKIQAVDNVYFAVSGACPRPGPAMLEAGFTTRSRYLSLRVGSVGANQAVRLKFVNLPGPLSVLNGATMWVGAPTSVSESGGSTAPVAGFADFQAATLGCSPVFRDWASFGTVYLSHANIVPSGQYEIQVVDAACSVADENAFSNPLTVSTSGWGDMVAPFDSETESWPPPDLDVGVFDVLAIIAKFEGRSTAPIKARCDLSPAIPDRIIDIQDLTAVLGAFGGDLFPATGPVTCP